MTTAANPPALKVLLRRVYEDYATKPASAGERAAREYDFEFHMTDWMNDFVKLGWAMFQPGTPPSDEAVEAVYAFLVHAVPHLNAAYETIHGEPVPNPFRPTPTLAFRSRPVEPDSETEPTEPIAPLPHKRRRTVVKK